MSVTYSECVSVALAIQHVKRMRSIVLSSVPVRLYHTVTYCLKKGTIRCFDFLYNLKACHPRCVRSITQSCSVCISIYTYSHEHNNITVSSDI